MIYPSKKDLWLVLLVLPVSLLLLGTGVFILSLVAIRAAPLPIMIPGLIQSVIGGLILWAMSSTYCEITSSDLNVHFGLVRVRIPLPAITEVIPKTGFAVEAAWGLAWSLDRVVVKYRKKNGKMAWLSVAVSPADKEGFMEELAEAVAKRQMLGADEQDR